MKKLFAIMLALVLALSCTAVLAEDAQPEPDAPFGGLWEAERTEIEINWEEEGYRVYIRGSDSATSFSVWEYSCLYDEATNTIKSMPTGIHTEVTVAEDGTETSNVVYEDGEAEFSLTEDGKLVWKDLKDDAGNGVVFEKADDPFEGFWECDRAGMVIIEEDDGYRAHIEWSSSATENSEFDYACTLQENALVSTPMGSRIDKVYDENGEVASSSTAYDDDVATFTLNDEGKIIWTSEKENFQNEMAFEKAMTLHEYLEQEEQAQTEESNG